MSFPFKLNFYKRYLYLGSPLVSAVSGPVFHVLSSGAHQNRKSTICVTQFLLLAAFSEPVNAYAALEYTARGYGIYHDFSTTNTPESG